MSQNLPQNSSQDSIQNTTQTSLHSQPLLNSKQKNATQIQQNDISVSKNRYDLKSEQPKILSHTPLITADNTSNSQTKNNPDLSNAMQLAIVATLLSVMYLIANIMAVKLINFNGLTYFDAGTIIFPFAYILGDVLTEVWGFRVAKKVIFLSFLCNIILVIFTNIGVILPAPEYAQETADAYAHIFTAVPRIVGASLVAFLCGELSNAWTMERIRIATKGKHLWFRAIASSMIGYIFDTVLFVLLAFAGTAPWQDLSTMIIFQYIAKILLEGLIATPFIYILVKYFRKRVPSNQLAHLN